MDKPYFGFYRAKVVDNKDPERMGRVVVWIPDLMPNIDPGRGLWARPANNPIGGRNYDKKESEHHYAGTSYIPKIDSWMWIFFENGNINRPYYFAALDIENAKTLPENQVGTNYEDKWTIFKSHKGRCIVISDDPDDRRIEITGQKRILVDPELPENNSGKLGDDYRPAGGDVDDSLTDTERLVYEIDGNQSVILFDERIGKEKILIRTYKGDFLHIDIDERKLHAYFKDDIHIHSQNSIYILADNNIHIKALNKMYLQSVDDMHVITNNNFYQLSDNETHFESKKDYYMSTDTDMYIKANKSLYQETIEEMHLLANTNMYQESIEEFYTYSTESMYQESEMEMHIKSTERMAIETLDKCNIVTGDAGCNMVSSGLINLQATDNINLYSDIMVRAYPGISSSVGGYGMSVSPAGDVVIKASTYLLETTSTINLRSGSSTIITAPSIHLDGAVVGSIPTGSPGSAGYAGSIDEATIADPSIATDSKITDPSRDATDAGPATEATPVGERDT